MWLTKLSAAIMAILAGLVPSSCSTSKNSMAKQAGPAVIIAASSESLTNKNLGEIQLTNHYERYVNLGAGKSCTIKPNLLNHKNVELMVALESRNAEGGVKGLSVVRVLAKTGQPFEVVVGDMNLTMTPQFEVQ